jgi:hypothetical protein
MGDRPGGHGHAALDQGLRNFRDTPVMAVAPLPHAGADVEAKLVLGERQASRFFRPIRLATLGTGRVEAAPNLEGETQDRREGGDGTVVNLSSG